MIENQVGTYQLPYGVALNFHIDGQDYVIPMAVEEPSVIAAASSAAKLIGEHGGFQTVISERIMIGQAILTKVSSPQTAMDNLKANEHEILLSPSAPALIARDLACRDICPF